MKKVLNVLIILLMLPIINVNAINCDKKELSVGSTFICENIKESNLSFEDINGKTIDNFSYILKDGEEGKKNAEITILSDFKPDAKDRVVIVNVKDGEESSNIVIKNPNYVEPTTTTTTKNPNIKEYTVTFIDGSNEDKKSCQTKAEETICNITLPKIDKETFNGWGTASTCKEGNIGTIKVDKDITYYACYKNNNSEQPTESNKPLYLKSLTLKDEKTEKIIDFGTFSIKKKEYDLKILYDVENIEIETTQEENIEVNIFGNKNLKVGENKIYIKLSDENNNEEEYILKVTRLEKGEAINNTKYLKSLVVGGYEINFDKEKFVYNLTIPSNIEKLLITPVAENEDDTPKVLNNENLINGSVIKIIVNEKDIEPTIYLINITKEQSNNYLLFVGLALIVILIIILIILIIIKKKKSKRTQPTRKPNNEKIEVLNI